MHSELLTRLMCLKAKTGRSYMSSDSRKVIEVARGVLNSWFIIAK